MEPPSEDINSAALESFREQWRAEVRARHSNGASAGTASTKNPAPRSSHRQSADALQKPAPVRPPTDPSASGIASVLDDAASGTSRTAAAAPAQAQAPAQAPPSQVPPSQVIPPPSQAATADPAVTAVATIPPTKDRSAVELYEDAVEHETRGNLGESLRLYRIAFRRDPKVEQHYKAKHFSAAWAAPQKPTASSSSSPSAKQPHTPRPSAARPQSETLDDLITSFAGLAIEPAGPPVEGMPPPPCPIAALPDEVLLHILQDVAVDDVADFVRLSQVCRRLAFLVATEERIWRRVCLGTEFGFAAMHRRFRTGVSWEPTGMSLKDDDDDDVFSTPLDREQRRLGEELALAHALVGPKYRGSWQAMFRSRPRVRFNGCYISTVNYIRAGQASANQVTWNSPVHICTYFRYLRFFRDGTCISLLTTTEPAEVVQYLNKESLQLHRRAAAQHLPSSVMRDAQKGRWRLGRTLVAPASAGTDGTDKVAADDKEALESEEDLFVETEGVGKYIYRLDLSLKPGTSRSARNNKLAWKGHYSYNTLTEELADFPLKTTRPFVFSRVKRYALEKS